MTTRVRLADQAADRPGLRSLATVAVGALCSGLALTLGLHALQSSGADSKLLAADELHEGTPAASTTTTNVEPAERAPGAHARDTHSALEAADESPTAAHRQEPPVQLAAAEAPQPPAHPAIDAARTERSGPVAVAPAQVVIAAPVATPDPNPVAPAAPRFKLGIVAYDRCDGLPQGPGRFPCPRDLGLEQSVWHALRALETCKSIEGAQGQSEVRYEWIRGAPMTMHVRTPKQGGLDHKLVSQCAGPALWAARTSLAPDHMVARFRFELR